MRTNSEHYSGQSFERDYADTALTWEMTDHGEREVGWKEWDRFK